MAVLYFRYLNSGTPVLVHVFLCVFAYIFFTPLLAVVPIVVLFQVYKLCVKSYLRMRRSDTIMDDMDKSFLFESEDNKNYMNCLMELEGQPNVYRLRKAVERRVLDNKNLDKSYKRLKQRVTKAFGVSVWTDEKNFDISQHMPVYQSDTLPAIKENISKIFAELASQSENPNLSPWFFKIVPMEDKKSFYFYCKFHHCIGDGFAMVGLLGQLVDNPPQYLKPSGRTGGIMESPIKKAIDGILTGPLALLTMACSAFYKWSNPFRAHSVPSKKTISWSSQISLELVKKIKNKTGVTVNDVILSSYAGAIGRYLQITKENEEIPKDFPISMSYNARSFSQKFTKGQIPLENSSGGLFVNLPISVRDPLERLSLMHETINKAKKSGHTQMFVFIYRWVTKFLPSWCGRLSTYTLKDHATLIFSNVPGPVKAMSIEGSKIRNVLILPPLLADLGLVSAAFSYNKMITLSVMSDENVISDPDRLTREFENEVVLLSERILLED